MCIQARMTANQKIQRGFSAIAGGAIAGLIVDRSFDDSVGIVPRGKQKRNVCAIKKWRLLVILIFRAHLFQ